MLKRTTSSEEIGETKRQNVAPAELTSEKGVAPIRKEFLVDDQPVQEDIDDDELEKGDRYSEAPKQKKGKRTRGQNKDRDLKQQHEEVKLCASLIFPNSNKECRFGPEGCRFTHNVDEYLSQKPKDIEGVCPVYDAIGYCPAGLKCRWLGSHFKDHTLMEDPDKIKSAKEVDCEINWISQNDKNLLQKKRFKFEWSEQYIPFLDSMIKDPDAQGNKKDVDGIIEAKKENPYVEAPFKVAEKKRLNIRGAKIVSPLTTVGNLPYRRLMKTLGADITYSEMALSLPLLQGTNSEWALPKAHKSEDPGFGVQIATSKQWQGCKAAEAISRLLPSVSEINLNCGCPIDLLYRQGQGSALLENPARLIRILDGMNACSGDIPVTSKIRMGVRDSHLVAHNLVKRLVKESPTACITLHGRTRVQRYTKEADWDYIAKVGAVVAEANQEQTENKDISDRDPVWFVGNGDCYTYQDWHNAVNLEGVDSVMVARGALIKPWIFEEVDAQQHLDKSASERLAVLESYAKFALEHWGSDEYGINTARRFMCEFISFTHRYIPVGVMEKMHNAKMNERPPKWVGRSDLETLLASTDYRDWIKITEMFLGPAGAGFHFEPKHKSNSYKADRDP